MKNSKLHKRQIFYIALYSTLIALSIIFLSVVFIFPSITLQSLTGVIFLLWLPLAFTTIITDIPQTVAGNIFMYKNSRNKQKRDYQIKTYSSNNFIHSDFYKFLILDDNYIKIKSVKVDRKFKKENKKDKNNYFIVMLKDKTTFRVTVIKRDKHIECRYTTKWIVDSVEQLSGDDVLKEYRDKVLSDVLQQPTASNETATEDTNNNSDAANENIENDSQGKAQPNKNCDKDEMQDSTNTVQNDKKSV